MKTKSMTYTVYKDPADFPGQYVVRGLGYAIHSTDYRDIERVMFAMRLVRVERQPGDDPAILETWL